MKKTKRLAVLLTIIMTMTILSGCGSVNTGHASSVNEKPIVDSPWRM